MRFVFASLFCLSAFAASPARLLDTTPIRFESGSAPVRWSAHGFGYSFVFTDQATVLDVGDRVVRLTFPGSTPAGPFQATDRTSVSTNYFVGKRYRSVPGFRRLRRVGVYPGIDVVYHGDGRQIEYDFEVAPGADASRIRMRFEGADAARLNATGEIVLTLGAGELTQHTPVVYQRTKPGEIVAVVAGYKIDHDGTVRLELGKYDPAQALVVDPSLTYAAYIEGTNGADVAIAVSHDAKGLVYLAGFTYSTDFPLYGDSYKTLISSNNRELWVMKLNLSAPPDQSIVYTSYIGGASRDDLRGVAVDGNGVMYLTGTTNSTDFPTTSGAYKASITADTHAFVAMLDPSQSGSAGLVYSTLLAGTGNRDQAEAIAVGGGKIYVTGYTNSNDFPTVGPYQSALVSSYEAFVSEIDPTLSGAASLVASTYLGGSALDAGRSIAVDAAGKVYVAGITFSADFPITSSAYQPDYAVDGEAFLTVLDLSASKLVYSTFLGGASEDEVKKILIDPAGRVAMTGYTLSPDFPVTQGAFQTVMGVNGNAFLTILDITKAKQGLVYSTFFGGSGGEVAYDLRRDGSGKYYLGGYTVSPDLPVSSNALSPSSAGVGVDGFVALIDPAAAPLSPKALVYSSYVTGPGNQIVYGVDVDASGALYAVGYTSTNVFPPGAAQHIHAGKYGGFLLVVTLP